MEIAVGIAAITFKSDLNGILNTQLQKTMSRQNKVAENVIKFIQLL